MLRDITIGQHFPGNSLVHQMCIRDSSYTTGLSPAVMEYMLKTTLVPRFGGQTSCDEIGLPVSATGGVVPCGATAIWEE